MSKLTNDAQDFLIANPRASDAHSIALIHNVAFQGFFLTTLGLQFLDYYYRCCMKEKTSIAKVVRIASGEVVAFATGSERAAGYHRKLLHNNFSGFIVLGLKIAITNPMSIVRLAKNLDKKSNPNDDGNYAELLSIGVSPSYAKHGFGKKLLREFEQEAKNRGCTKITLTTDKDNNDGVLRFYLSQGYAIFYEFETYPKRKMLKMIKQLD